MAVRNQGLIADIASKGFMIGDERVARGAGGTYEHHDPTTGKVQAEVVLAGAPDVDRAVAAARAALPAWRATRADERAAILFRLADLLDARAEEAAVISALEIGGAVSVMGPGTYTAQWVRYYAGWVDKLEGRVVPTYPATGFDYALPEPYGVVGVIPPWNGSMQGMGQKAAPALAAGNTVVAKPPELAPFGAYRFAELAMEAGVPPGVLNVVAGGPEGGDALVRHPGVDKVSFTGGIPTARKVMAAAAETLKPLAFELGGKTANIVFPDADLDRVIPMAAMMGIVVLSGQGCALPTRLYVHEDVYDDVAAQLVATVEGIAVGDPLDPATLMGPVVTEAACTRILGVIDDTVSADAGMLLTGGSRLGGELADGYFVAPTVFGRVDHDSPVARNEVFGPVLSVMTFRDEDEVVAKANDSEYGLGACVHTRDLERAHRVAAALDAGSVWVNGMGMSPTTPFGGVKRSGFGREGGRAGLEEFVRTKNVFIGFPEPG
jgi:acyl-CoA reductase-like NAD-dependent aldehyde dehydrogenase